ncbi:MAG: cysteine desulfurase [bacterium]|nr:cysteine desulfurase [bacterium]
MRTPVYLDNHASTAPDPAVLEVMQRVARDHFGNPAAGHAFGWAAAKVVEEAREHVAALIGGEPREVIFTSGATEADNLAVLGLAAAWVTPGHIVASPLEHAAVDGPLTRLADLGWTITRLPVSAVGVIDPADVAKALRPDTRLVCCVAAQNEIGTLQPLAALGRLCHERGVPLFSDGAQAAGRVPVDVARDGVALFALSAHKLHGPKGVGALYARRRDPRIALAPLAYGGGQERGLRPGTPDVAGIAGFGEACRLAAARLADDGVRLRALADRFLARVRGSLDGVILNGDPQRRLPGSLNLAFAGVPAGRLVPALPQLAVSTGSACATAGGAASTVLAAIGLPNDLAAASLRLCFSRHSTVEEADFAAEAISAAVRRLRGEPSVS